MARADSLGPRAVPCLIDARWAATKVTFDPNNDDIVTSNLTSLPAFDFLKEGDAKFGKADRDKLGISLAVKVTREWIATLDPPTFTRLPNNSTVDSRAVAALFTPFLDIPIDSNVTSFFPPRLSVDTGDDADTITKKFQGTASETLAAVLSMAVADGMSRSNYRDIGLYISNGTIVPPDGDITADSLQQQAASYIKFNNTISPDNLKRVASYQFTNERYGWGYAFQSSTVLFAVSILMIHAGLLVVYIAYLIVFRWGLNGWMSEAWADLGELLTLALLSREPTLLENTGVNVDIWKTWRYTIRVREREGDRVEMLVGHRKELHRKNEYGMGVQIGKKYA